MRCTALRAALVGVLAVLSAGAVAAAERAGSESRERASPPRIVVSIKPLHGIAAAVMNGVGEPELLLPGAAATPHGYSLKPSQMRALSRADLIFWVGPELETFLTGPLAALPDDVRTLSLLSALRRHADRGGRGAVLSARSADDWRTAAHARPAGTEGAPDPHLWLDPVNAAALASVMSAALTKIDPPHADIYRGNTKRFGVEMAALRKRMAARLAPVRERPFIVYHDSYQYLERRFGLKAVGAVTRGAHVNPGAAHLRRLRDLLESGEAVCVFVEPQFSPRVARTLVRDTPARLGRLDPLGGTLPKGAESVTLLFEALIRGLTDCLGAERSPTP